MRAGGGMAKVKETTAKRTGTRSGTNTAAQATKSDDKTGQFVWHELATTDPQAAEKYYKEVIGWGTKPFEDADPDEPYTMWTTGGVPRGGLMQMPEMARDQGVPPFWLTYIAVADTDAIVERVNALGGKLHHGPETITNVGRFAVVADPQGAAFGVISGEGGSSPTDEGATGTFSWHELTTSDAGAAWKFYAELFGWQKTEAMDMGGGNMYQMFGYPGGQSVGGMSKRTGIRPHWLPYVVVQDVEATVGRIAAGGGNVMLGPMEVPGGDKIAVATDPQGAA